jgi:tetratricopeptide (TPR) repeat protein
VRGRSALGRLVALGAGAWLALAAAPARAGGLPRVLVAPPQVDPGLAPLARGHLAWLEARMAETGAPTQAAALPGSATLDLSAALASARSSGADLVVRAELREREGRARVALRAHRAGSGELVAATLGESALADLGTASEDALRALLPQIGVPVSTLPEAPPATLDELAAAARALAALERGELVRAWYEVEGRLQPMAMRLRESILAAAQRPGPRATERARILAAAGAGEAASRLVASELERAAKGTPPAPELLLAQAEIWIARREPARARALADAALELAPQDPDALLTLGRALELGGDAAGAKAALERAARTAPGSVRPLERLAALEAAQPPQGARRLLALAALEAQRLEPDRSARSLARAVELDPRVGLEAARARARLAERMGRREEALAAYEEALARGGSRDPEVLVGVGVARRRTGAPEAEQPLRLAVELAPRHPRALRSLAELEAERGRPAQAAALLERALAAEPESEATRLELARALAATRGPAPALEVLAGAGAPEPREPETLQEIAGLERRAGRLDAARATLERALAAWPEEKALRSLLAAVAREHGDGAAAEALDRELAQAGGSEARGGAGPGLDFDELVLGFASQVSDARKRRVALLGIREPRDRSVVLRRWLHPREPDRRAFGVALERSLGVAFTLVPAVSPPSPLFDELVDRLFAFEGDASLDAEAIAQVNQGLGTDAVFAARLLRAPPPVDDPEGALGACGDPSRFELELRMLSGQHADVASILADTGCVASALEVAGAWNRRALLAYAALGCLLLFPILRGWGTLVVTIRLPPRTKGFLHIRIGRKPAPAAGESPRRPARDEGRLRRSLRSLSRFRKHMAGRETTFRWIPARQRGYYVTVGGPLLDAMGDEVIGHFLEEQRVRIERGKVARLAYDYCPNECAVEVRALRDGKPARGARAAVRGDPASLRYPRGGTAYFYLGVGSHTIVVGAGDRAAEKGVKIASIESAIPLVVDLGDPAICTVRDCAEAVEPYLLGDFAAAARALEAAGQEALAHLLWGAHHQQRGDLERAAAEFEAAGYLEEAAELRAGARDLAGSAALFERAGDFARAAEAHRAAGALLEAGRCYEQAYDYPQAIECYQEGGARERALELLEKIGAYLDAAALARELGQAERAIRNLQCVDRRDGHWAEACRRMAELLAERSHFDLAAQKIAEAIEAVGEGSASMELHERHAELLERAGRPREAIRALEALRRLAPTREDLARRIAALAGGLEGRPPAAPAQALEPGAPASARAPAEAERRYEVLGEIGRGGMGVVLKARDLRLGRLVALKRMPEHLRHDRLVAELFLREARAAAALNHPNIVTVYDAGVEEGAYFISMELLEGMPLDKILERRGRLRVADAARIGIQVAAGLHYAHERRIVHRDIKTGNLFFTREKVVKIMDFGLAKTIEEVRRASTVIGGTPYYMAPEQAAGEAVDARTDLYALGVTLFRMLTGTFPFREGDLAYHHRHTAAPDPRERAPDLPAALAELVLALLAKDPAERPRDAAEVGARLQAIYRSVARR